MAKRMPSVAPPPIRMLIKKRAMIDGMPSVDFLDTLALLAAGIFAVCCIGFAVCIVCEPAPIT